MKQAAKLTDYIGHLGDAAAQACSYVVGMTMPDYLSDRRTQQAVILNLMILGEASTRLMSEYPEFVAQQTQVPWREIKGMRNRIAHGYFELDLELVWNTVQTALPELVKHLPALQAMADEVAGQAKPEAI